MTKHPDIFASLAAPFAKGEVKTRPQGKIQLAYVTARTVMNRLDAVLGPENWWDKYIPGEESVICELTIGLPDGVVLTKCDAGGYAGMSDKGDDDKSGFSDAFKRAAVKFGVGRYLYRDGVVEFETPPPPKPTVEPDTAPAPRPPQILEEDDQPRLSWNEFAKQECSALNECWRKDQHEAGVPEEHIKPELVTVYQLAHAVCKRAKEARPPLLTERDMKAFMTPGGNHNTSARKAAQWLYEQHPSRVEATVIRYLEAQLTAAQQALTQAPDPEPTDDAEPVSAQHREPGADG